MSDPCLLDGDGLDDVVAQFEASGLLLRTTDMQGVVERLTPDGRVFRGSDSIQILKSRDRDRVNHSMRSSRWNGSIDKDDYRAEIASQVR